MAIPNGQTEKRYPGNLGANTFIFVSSFEIQVKYFYFRFTENWLISDKICWITLADLGGGAPGARPPPYGSRFFRFDMQNF